MALYADELNEIYRQTEMRRMAVTSALRASANTSSNVSSLMRDFPWLSPGTAYSLAVSGQIGPAAAGIANLDLQQQLDTNPTKFERNRLRTKRKKDDGGGGQGLFGIGVGPNLGPDLVPGDAKGFTKDMEKARGKTPVLDKVQSATRAAGVVANSGYQAVVGLGRSTASMLPEGTIFNPQYQPDPKFIKPGDPLGSVVGLGKSVAAQTEGGQVVASLARGESVDLGNGYLPSPDSPQAKRAAEAARYYSPQLYAGHAWTPGRYLADWVSEPDTTPYTILSGLIDATVALSPADPVGTALGIAGEARRAAKTFEVVPGAEQLVRDINATTDVAEKVRLMGEAGAGMGERPFIRGKNSVYYVFGPEGSRVADEIAAEGSWYKNWIRLGRKAPAELVTKLTNTTDPADVQAILAGELGVNIDRIAPYRQGIAYNRWLEDVPAGKIDPDNVDGTARNIELALKNAKVAPARIEQILNNYVGAYGKGERFAAIEAAFDVIKEQALANGASEKIATELGTMFKNSFKEANKYWVSSVTGGNVAETLKVGDTVVPIDGPMLSIERMNSNIFLPDPRTVRRQVSMLRPLYDTKAWKGAVGAGDWLMSVWKPSVLIRPALTMRVLGEEQGRLAATGTGLFHGPHSYVAAILGDSSKESVIGRFLSNLTQDPLRDEMIAAYERGGIPPPVELLNQRTLGEKITQRMRDAGTYDKRITGENFGREAGDQGLGDALTKAFSEVNPTKRAFLNRFVVANRNDQHAAEGFIGELRRLGSDADIQRSLRMSPDEMKAWGDTEVGLKWRADLAAGRDDAFKTMATNRETWDSYVDLVYKRRTDFTRGDSEILDVLRTGKFDGTPITDQFYNPHVDALNWARALLDQGRGPDFFKVQETVARTVGQHEQDVDVIRRAVGTLFDWTLTKGSNTLNRSPDFRIKYWNDAIDLAPQIDNLGRERLLKTLDEVHLPSTVKMNVRAAMANAPREGTLTAEAADAILSRRALDHVQNLLYDLHKRNQIVDVLRLVFPFGEAFKEVLTTWAKLLRDYPQVPRRMQQMWQGAKGAQFDPTTGLPVGTGGVGFFRYDPATRQEVFTYPGSEFLTKMLTGVPVPLVGPVKSLNIVGGGLPGVGPAISIPAAYFLPDKPKYDDLRRIIFPMGQQGQPLDVLMPAWARRLKSVLDGPASNRLYANTVFDVARYLNSTGEYDLQGDNAYDEMNRLLIDAKEKAKWLTLVRTAAQTSTPAAPAFNFQVEDKSGNLVLLQKVIDKYREKLKETDDPTATMDWFIQKFGVDNIFATQAKTTTDKSVGLTSTREQRDWARANSAQVDKYPNVWALFAPQGKTFDPAAYDAEIQAGQRTPLTPDEMARRANDRLARIVYDHAQESVAPGKVTAADEAYLRDMRDYLRNNYPGYGPDYHNRDLPTLIVQLKEALTDPKMARTQAGRGLDYYLQARDMAIEEAKKKGWAWPTTAKDAQYLRDYLTGVAQEASQKWPAFSRMWDQLLSQEVSSG